jgi:hypothetical protein
VIPKKNGKVRYGCEEHAAGDRVDGPPGRVGQGEYETGHRKGEESDEREQVVQRPCAGVVLELILREHCLHSRDMG